MFPAPNKQGNTLPSYFNSPIVNKYPFCDPLDATALKFLCFLLVISVFKMAPTGNTEELLSIPKHKKAVMYLMEKMHVE
jgi:hypothetical protein